MPSPLYLCLHLRDFAAQALTRARGISNISPRSPAVAILSGDPPLERTFAINPKARNLGLAPGMSRVQAESFPVVLLRRDPQQEQVAFAELMHCAERFSPRIETIASPQEDSCGATLVLDVSGSERLLGSARQIAEALRESIRGMEYESSVAAGRNACAAVLAARGIPGVTAIAPGDEAETLAPMPLDVLELEDAEAQTFETWGIHTLGQLAALPTKSLVARVGQIGFRLQAQARGEYSRLLVPTEEPADAMLCETIELEHPVELLEPLLFLLSQMLEQVTKRAAQRALAIASVETCFVLEGNAIEENATSGPFKPSFGLSGTGLAHSRPEHRRTVRPALPERDRHTLLKLIQLDLELHPPGGAVIALRIEAHPAPPQRAQQGLFAAQAPEAGRMAILLARLRKLVGEGRVGAPELLDSHVPEAFRVANFEIGHSASQSAASYAPESPRHASALRILRPPRAVAIELRGDVPTALHYEGRRLTVKSGSGPWRASGAWWTHPAWCREEWDVVLNEQPQRCLRLAHDPSAGDQTHYTGPPTADTGWYVIGIYD